MNKNFKAYWSLETRQPDVTLETAILGEVIGLCIRKQSQIAFVHAECVSWKEVAKGDIDNMF